MAGKHNHYKDKRFRRGYISERQAAAVAARLQAQGIGIEAAAKMALKQVADEIVADAKSRCPVYTETVITENGKRYSYIDERVKPGQLRDSIRAVPRRNGAYYAIEANAKVNTRKGPLYYGAIVEFSPRINKPFLYPALDAHATDIRTRVKAAIQDAIRGVRNG